VGVEGVARSGRQLSGVQQGGELAAGPGEILAAVVEDLGDGTPAGPAGQGLLLVGGDRAVFALDALQGGEGGQVGADPGDGAGGGQVVLARGAEGG
jgi:hypothetical protein